MDVPFDIQAETKLNFFKALIKDFPVFYQYHDYNQF